MKNSILALCFAAFALFSVNASAAPMSKATANHEEVKIAIANAVAAGVIDEQFARDLENQQQIMTPGELGVLLWNLSKAAAYAIGDLSWNTVKCIYDLATYAQIGRAHV